MFYPVILHILDNLNDSYVYSVQFSYHSDYNDINIIDWKHNSLKITKMIHELPVLILEPSRVDEYTV